jgi:hypothetical protein
VGCGVVWCGGGVCPVKVWCGVLIINTTPPHHPPNTTHLTSPKNTPHHVTLHPTTPHHTTQNHTTPHHTTPNQITLHHTTTPHHTTPQHNRTTPHPTTPHLDQGPLLDNRRYSHTQRPLSTYTNNVSYRKCKYAQQDLRVTKQCMCRGSMQRPFCILSRFWVMWREDRGNLTINGTATNSSAWYRVHTFEYRNAWRVGVKLTSRDETQGARDKPEVNVNSMTTPSNMA